MARFLGILALWLVAASPLAAQDTPIEDVISGQIEAFEAQDFDRAYGYASPMIRSLYQDPDIFARMVQLGYPMVMQPRRLRFLALSDHPRGKRQIVEIEDTAGRLFLLAYDMIETPDGWKINGVRVVPSPDVAA